MLEFLIKDLRFVFFFGVPSDHELEIFLKLMLSKMESLSILKMCTRLCLQVRAFDFISIAERFHHFVRNHVPMTYKFCSSVFTVLFFCMYYIVHVHNTEESLKAFFYHKHNRKSNLPGFHMRSGGLNKEV